ncbi:MAG: hypothetical protein ACERKD_24545 [Prolixibacteraceae bacterium]
MKKSLFVLMGLVFSILSFGQGKLYLMPEVGFNTAITNNSISNYQNVGLDLALKFGLDVTEHLALESGISWSKIKDFPTVQFFDNYPNSGTDNSYRYNTTSSNGFFSIPLHLKISHNIINDKWKVFTFFGPRFVFGTMSYSSNYMYNPTLMESGSYGGYNNALVSDGGISTKSFEPGFLFDGGFGIEYQLTPKFSLLTKGSFSMGSKRINSAIYGGSADVDSYYENSVWKGDGLSLSVGVKIRF